MQLIRNTCAPTAASGFVCILHGVERTFYPVLSSVVLDHKEMVDFAQGSRTRFSTSVHLRKGSYVRERGVS